MMMKSTLLIALLVVAACDKKQSDAGPAANANPAAKAADPSAKSAPAADPACAAKLKQFEPWLAQLTVEKRSQELDFGYKLQPIDRAPMPVSHHADDVEITKTHIAAFDVSEHDHAQNPLGEHPTPKAIADRLAKMHDLKASADEFDPAPDDLLRIDVDVSATWGDVVRVLDAATAAGYTQALFVFTAKSQLAQPPGVDSSTTSQDAAQSASDKLDALRAQCKPWDRAAMHIPGKKPPAEDAADLAKAIAAGFVECNCKPDPDEVRKLMWIDAHWHQAVPRVGITVPLDKSATTTIALPAKTPWSDAHAKLLEATGPVKLAAR